MSFIFGYLIGAVLAYGIMIRWGNPIEWLYDKYEYWRARKKRKKLGK